VVELFLREANSDAFRSNEGGVTFRKLLKSGLKAVAGALRKQEAVSRESIVTGGELRGGEERSHAADICEDGVPGCLSPKDHQTSVVP
jgi:hypothetical protein